MRPVLIDLFCKAGGCTKGYQRAGFYVIGVDIEPQPHYCGDEFIRDDVMALFDHLLDGGTEHGYGLSDFGGIHASPPCQFYSRMATIHPDRDHPDLVGPVRDLLVATGKPYVIENVEGAPLLDPVTLCGSMFGLKVLRHRLFEASFPIETPPHGSHDGEFYTPAGHGDPNWRRRDANPHLSGVGYTERCRQAMGIDWMNRDELAQAIPPAYTEWIGRQLIDTLDRASV